MGRRMASTLRKMSEPEAAWMGGMFEGDGHYTMGSYIMGGKGPYFHAEIGVTNNLPEVISACLRATGTGRVRLHSSPIGSEGPMGIRKAHTYRWILSQRNTIEDFFRAIAPYSTKAQTGLAKLKE